MGVCGGVAAYKAAGLARLLTREYSVQTILTPTAQEFVGAATFRALTGREVATDEFRAPVSDNGMDHISLTRGAAGMVVAPATADFMAKAAAGMADNLLLTAFLAADCPKWIAPAMNQNMWRAAATRRNADILAADGAIVLPPDSGEQACGDVGPGRMMEPEEIVMRLRRRLSSLLVGRKVVVSTGATAEKIDPMRLITNRSSGAMGFCLAQAAEQAGANVRIIAAHTSASPPSLPIRRVENGREMLAAVLEECRDADMFFSAAAVADYRPSSPTSEKIPRQKGKITLSMSPSEDILAAAVKHYPRPVCGGLCRAKRRQKGANCSRPRKNAPQENRDDGGKLRCRCGRKQQRIDDFDRGGARLAFRDSRKWMPRRKWWRRRRR